jgi:hypothetical protein
MKKAPTPPPKISASLSRPVGMAGNEEILFGNQAVLLRDPWFCATGISGLAFIGELVELFRSKAGKPPFFGN